MSSSKDLKSPGLRPRNTFLTTYRSDYIPMDEHPLQVYQLNRRPEHISTSALITPPKLNSDIWARLCKCYYKTVNSTYGSSPFAQTGLVPVGVTVLEGDTDIQGGEGTERCVLPALETSSSVTTRPQGPLFKSRGAKQDFVSSPGVASTHPGPAPKEDRTQEITVAKKALPIIGQEMTVATKGQLTYFGVPKYNQDHLSLPSRAARLCHNLLNQPASTATTTKTDAQVDTTTRRKAFSRTVGLKESISKPLSKPPTRPWQTEYTNTYGFPKGPFPPHVPRGSTLHKAHRRPSTYYLVPKGKTLLSEYQAGYTAKVFRPKICPLIVRKHAS